MSSNLERLQGLLAISDASLKFETCTRAMWSGELRLTLTNPPGQPSRSITFYSVGGLSPEDVAGKLWADADLWLSESDQRPLAPLQWGAAK